MSNPPMRPVTVMVLSCLGMLSSTLFVVSLTPGRAVARAQPPVAVAVVATHVELPGAIQLDARVGHATLSTRGNRETYLLATARAPEHAKRTEPLAVAILIDRSGSMRGRRLAHALSAARGMIERLGDGDRVTVMAYDTGVSTLLSTTRVDAASRRAAAKQLSTVSAKGNTCISCALSAGMAELAGAPGIKQILLLSDVEATAGVRTMGGFERLARRAREAGIGISSIGVDVDYNEALLSLLARLSNGRHHFVRDPGDMDRAFDDELAALGGGAATDARLTVTLAHGVRLLRVFDRAVEHDGQMVVARLGTFSAGDEKTLLLQVRLPPGQPGNAEVAGIAFDYRASGSSEHVAGAVGTQLVGDPSQQARLDPVVAARLGRSRTGTLLFDSAKLYKSGEPADFSALDQRFANELSRLDKLDRHADPTTAPDLHAQKKALRSARTKLRAARAARCGCPASDLRCALRCSAPPRHHAAHCAPGDPLCGNVGAISDEEKAAAKSSVSAADPFMR